MRLRHRGDHAFKIKPIVETFSPERATAAYDRLASGKMRFRGAFTPAQAA